MKKLFLIGGTMGVGKTTVCGILKNRLDNSVFLDGDRCWDAHPFKVTEETKKMVLENIRFILNNFLHCSEYDNVIFCWVMHEQGIIDEILSGLDTDGCEVKSISLTVSETELKKRLCADIAAGIRASDVLERSVSRIPLYEKLETVKKNTSDKTPSEVAEEIAAL